MPSAIVKEKNVFNGPRNESEEISDMYIGAMLVDKPAPKPTKVLAINKNSNDSTSWQHAKNIEPVKYNSAMIINDFFLFVFKSKKTIGF